MLKRLFLIAVLCSSGSAWAQTPNLANGPASTLPLPLYSGPFDPSNGQLYLNNLIVSLNQTLGVSMPVSSTSANIGTITGSISGSPVVIGVGSATGHTADTNVAIAINPAGNGNLILFNYSAGTGMLQTGNPFSFQRANGVERCPGAIAGQSQFIGGQGNAAVNGGPLMAGGTVVTGFVPIADWTGRVHKLVACG